MSTPTTQQGKNIPLTIGTDGITYKNLVCEQAHDATFDSPITEESSDCGKHTALDVVGLVVTFSGIVNTTPNGATESSSDDIIGYANNQTQVYVKFQHGNKFISARGYINNLQLTKATAELLKYSFTFTMNGTATVGNS